MDLQHLKEHYGELISFMEDKGYSKRYIQNIRLEVNCILKKAGNCNNWNSYADIYNDYLLLPYSEKHLKQKRTILGVLEQFDVYGIFPGSGRHHALIGRNSYHLLNPEFESIDWETERINIIQEKTAVPLELPLSAVVGNAIYDYIAEERPDTGNICLFLSENFPYSPVSSGCIAGVVSKAFQTAGIRQNKGDRKGTHIFRHHLAAFMLENAVPQHVISQTLGHTAPESLEPYLGADLVHLKECALSVEPFPLAKEVLSI